jgi:hypothetical protein
MSGQPDARFFFFFFFASKEIKDFQFLPNNIETENLDENIITCERAF